MHMEVHLPYLTSRQKEKGVLSPQLSGPSWIIGRINSENENEMS